MIRINAVNHKAPLVVIDHSQWLQVIRAIGRAADERTTLTGHIPLSGAGNSAPVIDLVHGRAVASALVLANMNSLPLDWAARYSVGGANMSFFIVKQLPVLPPEAYLESIQPGRVTFAELVASRVLELTYTSTDLAGFAKDLGYETTPFIWDDDRRHRLRSELDAIFARMYELGRDDLEWMLDPPSPNYSFPTLKRNELAKFGEYRTRRLVLQAFDQLERGNIPSLTN